MLAEVRESAYSAHVLHTDARSMLGNSHSSGRLADADQMAGDRRRNAPYSSNALVRPLSGGRKLHAIS